MNLGSILLDVIFVVLVAFQLVSAIRAIARLWRTGRRRNAMVLGIVVTLYCANFPILFVLSQLLGRADSLATICLTTAGMVVSLAFMLTGIALGARLAGASTGATPLGPPHTGPSMTGDVQGEGSGWLKKNHRGTEPSN